MLIHFGVHHFPSPQRAIMQAHRVLRAGGRLAFTVWAPPAEHALHRIAIEAVRAAADAGASLPVPPQGPLNEAAACRRLLEDAGFAAPAVQTLHGVLKLDGVAELVHMMQAGTVRLSALIRSQGPVRGAAILAEIEKSAAAFCVDGGLEIPVAAILASAVK